MRLYRFIIFILVSCLIVLSKPLLAEDARVPELQVAEPEYDFGNVGQGTKITHDFVLRNTGTSDLHIQRVVPSCGCTTSSLDSDKIAPGTEAQLSVTFDTSGFAGEKVKTVRLYTNDPDQLTAILTLKGSVIPEVEVVPRRVFFGEITEGTPASRDVTITIREGSSVRIKSIVSRSPDITLHELEASDTKRVLRVDLSPDTKEGEVRDRIVVLLQGDNRDSINIPVYASVTGAIDIKPSAISFGVITDKVETRTLTVVARSPAEFSLNSVEVDSDALAATFRPLEPKGRYEVTVRLDGSKVHRMLRGTVRLVPTQKSTAPLIVSVYGIRPPEVS